MPAALLFIIHICRVPTVSIMATFRDIEGIADQWEEIASIRERVRSTNSLFMESVGGRNLDINIVGAEYHADVLMPLLRKLVHPETKEVGMCAVPDLETECLVG